MDKRIKRFERLIGSMNLPENRKQYNRPNVLWFVRNGALQNRQHQNFNEAVQLARELM